MQNEILINASPGETRVAILEHNQFVEFHLERAKSRGVVGDVVLGRVNRVLPGMQAAFVDIGLEKAAFLYAGDYVEDIERLPTSGNNRGGGRRGRARQGNRKAVPNIEEVLKEGQDILVQVAKDPIGTKGARITSHISIAGRHLVLTPWAQRVGVSRRIDSDKERRRLREVVEKIRPKDLGFIIRTAGAGTREADLEADVRYLTAVWDDIQILKDQVRAPSRLYTEPDLPLKVIRDVANSDTKRIVVDSEGAHQEMKTFVSRFVADPKPKIERYEGLIPIFDHYKIESRIDSNLGRKVWLKSGGSIIIDQSEALTAIDVNTGRYVGKRDLEQTVLRTNLEAVKEVVYQLRFRNIGGLIIIDLIDMENMESREKVNKALQDALRQDKARTNILKISELGLVEMTRKRTRENLVQAICEPCSNCEGKGYLVSAESIAHKVLREIKKDLRLFCGNKVAVEVHRRVAQELLGQGRAELEALEKELGREIEIRAKSELHQEQFQVTALNEGPAISFDVAWLKTGTPKNNEMPSGEGSKTENLVAEPNELEKKPSTAGESVKSEPLVETEDSGKDGTEAPSAS